MYVKANNGTVEIYPYSIGRLRKENPNTSFPKRLTDETLAEYGLYRVGSILQPEYDDRIQRCVQKNQPELVDGKWVLGWDIYDKTQEQIDHETESQAESIRARRNEALKQCDWTVVADSPLSDELKAEWLAYRQALRDISDLEGFPYIDLPNDPDFKEASNVNDVIELA